MSKSVKQIIYKMQKPEYDSYTLFQEVATIEYDIWQKYDIYSDIEKLLMKDIKLPEDI